MGIIQPVGISRHPGSSTRNVIQPSGDFTALLLSPFNGASVQPSFCILDRDGDVALKETATGETVAVNLQVRAGAATCPNSAWTNLKSNDSSPILNCFKADDTPAMTVGSDGVVNVPLNITAGGAITATLELVATDKLRGNNFFVRGGAATVPNVAWSNLKTGDTSPILHLFNASDVGVVQFDNAGKITSADNLELTRVSSTSTVRLTGTVSAAFAVAADASRQGRMLFSAVDFNATREFMRGEADGTNPKIGVLGATAAARQTVTGSRGGNAALASLLTAMATFGWITDSTSA